MANVTISDTDYWVKYIRDEDRPICLNVSIGGMTERDAISLLGKVKDDLERVCNLVNKGDL